MWTSCLLDLEIELLAPLPAARAPYHVPLALAYQRAGDLPRALYYLSRSYEVDPQDPQTVYSLAFAA